MEMTKLLCPHREGAGSPHPIRVGGPDLWYQMALVDTTAWSRCPSDSPAVSWSAAEGRGPTVRWESPAVNGDFVAASKTEALCFFGPTPTPLSQATHRGSGRAGHRQEEMKMNTVTTFPAFIYISTHQFKCGPEVPSFAHSG